MAELGQKVGEKIEYKGQKLTNFQKKKGLFRPKKNKLGLSLRRKNKFFGSTIGKIFENNVQKLSNFKENKGLFGPKKTSWGLA